MIETHDYVPDRGVAFHDWTEATGIHELRTHGLNLNSKMELPVYTAQTETTRNQIQRLTQACVDEGVNMVELVFKRRDEATGKLISCDGTHAEYSYQWDGWVTYPHHALDSCFDTLVDVLGKVRVIPEPETVYHHADEAADKITQVLETEDIDEANRFLLGRALYLINGVTEWIKNEACA